MSGSIYVIRHLPSGRHYVGATRNVVVRWQAHQATLKAGKHHSKALQQAFDADGLSSLEFSVVETDLPNEQVLVERESSLIAELGADFNTLVPSKLAPPTTLIRKGIALPASMWKQIEAFRAGERIISETEAVRRIIADWLKARQEP